MLASLVVPLDRIITPSCMKNQNPHLDLNVISSCDGFRVVGTVELGWPWLTFSPHAPAAPPISCSTFSTLCPILLVLSLHQVTWTKSICAILTIKSDLRILTLWLGFHGNNPDTHPPRQTVQQYTFISTVVPAFPKIYTFKLFLQF